jgi:hypothetical protein
MTTRKATAKAEEATAKAKGATVGCLFCFLILSLCFLVLFLCFGSAAFGLALPFAFVACARLGVDAALFGGVGYAVDG